MNSENLATYYLRARGRVTGPFTVPQLKKLHARGRFSRACQVSHDSQNWTLATSLIDEFFIPVAPVFDEDRGEELDDAPAANPQRPPQPRKEGGVPAEVNDGVSATKVALGMLALFFLVGASLLAFFVQNQSSTTSDSHVGAVGFEQPRSSRFSAPSSARASEPVVPIKPIAPSDFDTAGAVSAKAIDSIDDPAAEKAVGKVVTGFTLQDRDQRVIEVPLGMGTGFLISAEGDILTNHHVIESYLETEFYEALELALQADIGEHVRVKPAIWVFYDRHSHSAELSYFDKINDLAILKSDWKGQSYFALAKDDTLSKGIDVRVYGFPGAADMPLTERELDAEKAKSLEFFRKLSEGENVTIEHQFAGDQLECSLTKGVVSRIITRDNRLLIQHDAAINPGNSGGPLITSDGLVHGLNTYRRPDAPGIYFSISTGQLRRMIDQNVQHAVWK